jgi:oxidoreductase
MSERIPLAVLGAGWVVQHGYAPHFVNGPFRLLAVHDPDPAALDALERLLPHVPAVASVEACLDAPARAVLVATPSASHVELAALALRAGRHVLCEKPVAVRSAQVRELALAEARGGGRLAAAAVCRQRADVRRFLAGTAALGAIEELELVWVRQHGVPAPGSWRTRADGGMTGVLGDLGYHLLDLAVAVAGADRPWVCTRAQRSSSGCGTGASWFGAVPASHRYDVDDRVEAWLHTAGTRLRLRAAWVDDQPGDLTALRATSRRGTVELQGLFGFSNKRRIADQVCTLCLEGSHERVRFEPGPRLQREAFGAVLDDLAAVCRGAPPAVGLRELQATVDMIEAIAAATEPV